MSETGNSDKTVTAAQPKATLHLKRPVEQGTVRQSFSHGRSTELTSVAFAVFVVFEWTAALTAAPTPADASTNTTMAIAASTRRVPFDGPVAVGGGPQLAGG